MSPLLTWEGTGDVPNFCPEGCGGITEDVYGGPCKTCWAEVDAEERARRGGFDPEPEYDPEPEGECDAVQSGAADELTVLTEELGLYGQPPVACMTHLRMVPCRKAGPHVLSSEPGDVARASRFAAGRGHREGEGVL